MQMAVGQRWLRHRLLGGGGGGGHILVHVLVVGGGAAAAAATATGARRQRGIALGGVHRVVPTAAQTHLGCLIVYEILDFIVTGGTPLRLGGRWLQLLLLGAGSGADWGPGSLIDPGHGQCSSRALTLWRKEGWKLEISNIVYKGMLYWGNGISSKCAIFLLKKDTLSTIFLDLYYFLQFYTVSKLFPGKEVL